LTRNGTLCNDKHRFEEDHMRGSRKLPLLPVVVLLAVSAVALANVARAAQLTGTVTYTGSLGPVSSSRPILLLLAENGATVVVTVNGGAFTFDALAPGNYTLVYVLDLNNDGRVSVGEPGLIYNNRQNFPGDPVAVPGPALALHLGDTLVAGISGTATYTGTKGSVNNISRIRVHAYADASLTNFTSMEGRTKVNGGRYDVVAPGSSSPLYLKAFLDLNGNDVYDAGEPFQIYNHKGAPPADGVVPGPHQTSINFTFGDENVSSGEAQLTGTVHYTGSQGPVSASHPIRLFLFQNDPLQGGGGDTKQVDQTVVSANGGGFTLHAPAAGSYYLAYELDVIPNDPDNNVNVGEPFQFYDQRFVAPADAIAVPRAGVALSFDDTARLPGIAGTITYTGSRGPVSDTSRLIVEAFSDSTLTQNADDTNATTNGGRYDFIRFDTTPTYLRTFFDVNGNGQFDADEPFQIYNGKSVPPGDPVTPGPDQDAVDFEFGDPTTATCAGDCNDDTVVTVEELLTLVNIALGDAGVGTCLAGDTNHDNRITIDEILTAVNKTLNGCAAG
jgi:hypothetical protein